MSDRYEIRIAGEGGQGAVLAGMVLGEAAVMYDNKNAIMTQSYAAQQRGGPSRAEVIISDGEIDYPEALEPDLLVALSPDAFERYSHSVRRDGLIILDAVHTETATVDHARLEEVTLSQIAQEATGSELAANIVALGVITELSRAVSRKAVLAALAARAPKGSLQLNKKALRAGFKVGRKLRGRKASVTLQRHFDKHS
ncbi:MAG: 2-oxoacid:acceptor oxidoreductase family protein [Chloroflexi bacterium]|nr:2-oxoacid:acceptor oxidoreductase family protein [Chloroflexota bacterium]